ncbi:MAG: DNA-binding transcriptional regulator [Candidatus Aramenus sulfurataquae]|uniref:Sugar fermentation stimulation protein homolog n=2 Tax=Candidatus Aramenus sulfurataquae TaxID=1326980 RepID=W7KTI5_9CREN|nr:MAG: DNA-binding transcriptional regulator [Candidatus Aramenus sulfurataquae]
MFVVYEFPELHEEVVKERVNRFLVLTASSRVCHLHDPGRLKELIYPGNRILVREVKGGKRKTDCQVTAAWDGTWAITDSSVHSQIAEKFLPGAKREVKVGNSRLDFQFGDTFVEVKGCTLAKNRVALFPDAPTERGRRHLEELIRLKEKGYRAKVMVLVMRDDVDCFLPNAETDKKFAETFYEALRRGVELEVKVFSLVDKQYVVYKRDVGLCTQDKGS